MLRARAYGLTLELREPIPGLEPQHAGSSSPADLQLITAQLPPWTAGPSTIRYQTSADLAEPSLQCRDFGAQRHSLEYGDGTTFHLDLGTGKLWLNWAPPLTLEDTATYLLGPVLAFVLRQRRNTCLHGSTVCLGDGAVAFVGPSGSGKSTIAAAFAHIGGAVVSEDVTCVTEHDGEFLVQPGYPRVRLWDDGARLAVPQALPLLTPNWDKRFLALDGRYRFHDAPARLTAIYLLGERRTMDEAAETMRLTGHRVITELVANSYGHRLIDGPLRAREFEVIGRLARAVPVYRLHLNRDGKRLAEACRWLHERATADA